MELHKLFEMQMRASRTLGTPSAELRAQNMRQLIEITQKYSDAICEAAATDYAGNRSKRNAIQVDVLGAISPLRSALGTFESWMEPTRCQPEEYFAQGGAALSLQYRPRGVVGILGTWNFPFFTVFSPLADALAAGNRIIVKPSEITPRSAELIAKIVEEACHPQDVACVLGDAALAAEVCALPLGHLIFTGSTQTGKKVMAAAAQNLTPVTLELGGKCPTLIGADGLTPLHMDRLTYGKLMNSGQVCLAPDYALVSEQDIPAFIDGIKTSATKLFPDGPHDPDYGGIVNEHHFERLQSLLADAVGRGAEVVNIYGNDTPKQKMPLQLVLNVTDDMRIMKEEIFGPILPIKTISDFKEGLDYIAERPGALAAYLFSQDSDEIEAFSARVHAGGVNINDVAAHPAHSTVPFGGVGASGIGSMHGIFGFKENSHAMPIYKQAPEPIDAPFRPPWDDEFYAMMSSMVSGDG